MGTFIFIVSLFVIATCVVAITIRKARIRAAKIRREKALFEAALSKVPLMTVLLSSKREVIHASIQFVKTFVRVSYSVEGRHLREIVDEGLFNQLMELGTPSDTENVTQDVLVPHGKGILASYECTRVYLPEAGGATLFFLRDATKATSGFSITEDSLEELGVQKYLSEVEQGKIRIAQQALQLEEQSKELEAARDAALQATHAKTMFLANMSHELRTPMNGVMGIAQLLSKEALSPQQKEYVEIILGAARDLVTIVNDILDSSKMESGKFEILAEELNIGQTLDSVAALLEPQMDQRGIVFVFHLDPRIPKKLIGDSNRIRQIIVNLVGNASKFTRKCGAVVLAAHLSELTDGEAAVTIAVSDTGIGIPEEKQQRIFTPFAQGDSTTAKDFGGTGLGLSISKRLVDLMGGRLSLRSRPGDGSVFYFTAKFSRMAEGSLTENPETVPTKRLRILVAENDFTLRKLVVSVLENMGHRCFVATDGQDAVDKFTGSPFDIIFMDCEMPRVDGYSATRLIRQSEKGQHIPIVALSEGGRDGEMRRCIEAGMNDLVEFPLNRQLLQAKLLELVK